MRVLAQRVSRASVAVAGETVGTVGSGFVLLVGITHGDDEAVSRSMAGKVSNLRVFDDENGQMNRSILDVAATTRPGAGVLVISQFTLYADARKGRRPSYADAAPPAVAGPLVEHFARSLAELGLHVEQGRFGAEMAVELVNDGPVTIWLDSAELRF
jgi:D-tyrosyl-tRNA(Tyr) deacylase